jgi:hypothetical protein
MSDSDDGPIALQPDVAFAAGEGGEAIRRSMITNPICGCQTTLRVELARGADAQQPGGRR